jgi:hypothetical protein
MPLYRTAGESAFLQGLQHLEDRQISSQRKILMA